MSNINPQASELNEILINNNSMILDILSEKGKKAFFPKKGIISQSADAKGKDINATIGMALEDDGSPMVLEALKNMINLDDAEQAFAYAGSFGNPVLRKLWLDKMIDRNGNVSADNVSNPLVTNALTHGLSVAGHLFINDGDELLLPDLYWGNYRLIFTQAYGAQIKIYKTFDNDKFNLAAFAEAINNSKQEKIVTILNFPNNPSGYTPTEEEMDQIKKILVNAADNGKKIVAICDDAYFGLVFEEGIITESPFDDLHNLHENILAVKIDGATKEDYVWGFRVGFMTFAIKNGNRELYNALEAKAAGIIRGSISNAPNISQFLLNSIYQTPDYKEVKQKKYETLKNRYKKVKEILKNHPEYEKYFKALPFNSGYFMCVELNGLDAEKVRVYLLDKFSVGLIALGKILRVAFSATPIDKLEVLFDSLYQACEDLS